jgi:hypothetical protein
VKRKALVIDNEAPIERRPSSGFVLTDEEIAMLPDPEWVTEDDADAIYAHRHRHEPGIPLEDVLKRLGHLDRKSISKR